MRLIDVDSIEINEECTFSGKGIKSFLDAIPTAYDIDKVMERLEDMKYVMMGNYGVRREVVNFDDLVETVKSGGIE